MIPLIPFVPLGVGIPSCFAGCDGDRCPAKILRDQGIFLILFTMHPFLPPLRLGRN